MLRIDRVGRSFGDAVALEAVSLEVAKGEFVAILGPSGCGKTTLLRIVGGFLEPTTGQISLNGDVLSEPGHITPVEERNLGMVFQSFALWPHMTVREHVEFPLKSKRWKSMDSMRRRQVVDEALAAMRIEALADRLPAELSGGQRQRVALARAIVAKPALLLMDEPLSALDAELKMSMRSEIQNIHAMTGATILYVTHDQSEALSMADRVVIMKDGRIEQVGTPEEVYRHPQTRFAATFVSKANLVRGSWAGRRFTPFDGSTVLREDPADPVAESFKREGLYPVRPEDFMLADDGEGLEGVIENRQYEGRTVRYVVRCGAELFTAVTPAADVHRPGQAVRLRLRER